MPFDIVDWRPSRCDGKDGHAGQRGSRAHRAVAARPATVALPVPLVAKWLPDDGTVLAGIIECCLHAGCGSRAETRDVPAVRAAHATVAEPRPRAATSASVVHYK